jgi:hypothetical protein
LTDKSIEVLESIIDGSDDQAKTSDKLKAVEIVLARAWGNPVQAVDLSGEDGENQLKSIKIEFIKSNE